MKLGVCHLSLCDHVAFNHEIIWYYCPYQQPPSAKPRAAPWKSLQGHQAGTPRSPASSGSESGVSTTKQLQDAPRPPLKMDTSQEVFPEPTKQPHIPPPLEIPIKTSFLQKLTSLC